ncbi:MAG: STAS domain-containing protein [Spirochaetales bacterium]|jgi:anti-anti-sigma factor|nr:STAS domain-containing protein [Spirochaetales bacterium]
MDVDISIEKDTIKIKISGPIDTEGSSELTTKFIKFVDDKTMKYGVFDLTEVPTITSAGIGKLLQIYKYFTAMGGSLKISGISEALREQFTEIHLDRIIPIV